MSINFFKPLRIEEIMASSTLSNAPNELIFMRVGNTNSVVTATAQSPDHDFLHIESPVLGHPIKKTRPQSVRCLWVRTVGWTIRCTRDFDNNRSPVNPSKLSCRLPFFAHRKRFKTHQPLFKNSLHLCVLSGRYPSNPVSRITAGHSLLSPFLSTGMRT